MTNTSAIWQHRIPPPTNYHLLAARQEPYKKQNKKTKPQLLTKNVCICVTGLSPLISELAQHIKLMLSQCRDQRTVSRLE